MSIGRLTPARSGLAVSLAGGDVDLPSPSRLLIVGTGGALHVDMLRSGELTIPAVPDGAVLPLQVTRIYSDSAAGNITVFW